MLCVTEPKSNGAWERRREKKIGHKEECELKVRETGWRLETESRAGNEVRLE